jgi:hypothetical protein
MAPMAPVGRDRAIKLVKSGKLPVWLGSPHPFAMIVEQDGVFRIRDLVIDEDEARVAREEGLAKRGMWMPEQYYALGRPTGKVHVEARSRDALVAVMRTMTWNEQW